MPFVTLAAAILLAPIGTADPDQVLKDIRAYQTEQIQAAQKEKKAIDYDAVVAHMRQMAKDAIKGVDPAKIEPAKGLSWMQLYATAEEYKDIEILCKQFMMSNPTPAQRFSAELNCLSAYNQLGNTAKGVATVNAIVPPDETSAMTLASYATAYFAEPMANEQGLDAAEKFLDGILAKLPDSVADDKLKPRLASAVSSVYETKGEILINHGQRDKGLAAFEAGLKDPRIPEASARSLKFAGIRAGMVGTAPPEIPVTDKYRDFTSVEALKGKVVIIDFMAHWCGPCKAAFPDIHKLYEKYKDKGLEVLSVTRYYGYYDTQKNLNPSQEYAAMAGFLKQYQLDWPVIFTENDTFADYGITGIPTMVVIGRDGLVRTLHVGYSAQSFKEVETLVGDLIKEKN